MSRIRLFRRTPGLLVSVRSTAEAIAALQGGADVIDVKEPTRGPLGPADDSTVANIVRVLDGRALVTAAMGELLDFNVRQRRFTPRSMPAGVALVKFGLRGCRQVADWPVRWQTAIESLGTRTTDAPRLAAVVYADWSAAAAPAPAEVLEAAIHLRSPALLIDTWDKSNGTLFDHWPAAELASFLQSVRQHRIAIVLAGSIGEEKLRSALALAPDLVAVRGAACKGGRNGILDARRVTALKRIVEAAAEESSHTGIPQTV